MRIVDKLEIRNPAGDVVAILRDYSDGHSDILDLRTGETTIHDTNAVALRAARGDLYPRHKIGIWD